MFIHQWRTALLAIVCMLAPLSVALAQTDDFGYELVTNPTVPFEWVDIEQPENEITGLTDDNFVEVDLGFDFKYYWSTFNKFSCGSNGYLQFGPPTNVASGASGFDKFPTPGGVGKPNNLIGMLLTDLTFTDKSKNLIPTAKLYGKKVGNTYVLTYSKVPYWVRENEVATEFRGENTFQVILNGDDKSVTLQYKDCIGPVAQPYQSQNFNCIGIENVTGEIGIQASIKEYPENGTVYKFVYPATPGVSVTDVSPVWIFNERNQGTVLPIGSPVTIKAAIRNTGTDAITATDPVTVSLKVYDYFASFSNDGQDVEITTQQDEVTITSLAPDEEKVVEFSKKFSPEFLGNFVVEVTTSNILDLFEANNTALNELMAVDTVEAPIILAYDRFIDRSIAEFSQQEDGLVGLNSGMSFQPPFEPFTISDLGATIVVASNGASRPDTICGHELILYGSTPAGAVGQELARVDLTPDDILGLLDNSVQGLTTLAGDVMKPLPTPIKVQKGPVYLAVIPKECDTQQKTERRQDFVVAEQQGARISKVPNSFRSYEISGNVWAPYRERSTTDFALRVGIQKFDGEIIGRNDNQFGTIDPVYPNPASDRIAVPFTVKAPANASLKVVNAIGQTVYQSEIGTKAPGKHTESVSTAGFANGLYHVVLSLNGEAITTKVMINR